MTINHYITATVFLLLPYIFAFYIEILFMDIDDNEQKFTYPPGLFDWSDEQKRELTSEQNYSKTDCLIKYTTNKRTLVNEKFANWAINVSHIRRRPHIEAERKDFWEAKCNIQFASNYIDALSVIGIDKFIETHISSETADTIIPQISWVDNGKRKNIDNMEEISALIVYFRTEYPSETEQLIEKITNFDQLVLRSPSVRDKIIKATWYTYNDNSFPFKYKLQMPNLHSLIAADTRASCTIQTLSCILFANIPGMGPKDMEWSIKFNNKSNKLNLKNIHISCTSQPWPDIHNARYKILTGWKFLSNRTWNSLEIIVSILGHQKSIPNQKALIKNDGIINDFNKIVTDTSRIKDIVHKIYTMAFKQYNNNNNMISHQINKLTDNIRRIFSSDLITGITTETIFNYGTHNKYWSINDNLLTINVNRNNNNNNSHDALMNTFNNINNLQQQSGVHNNGRQNP